MPHFELARANLDDLKQPPGKRNAPWFYSFSSFVSKKLVDGLMKRMAGVRGKGEEVVILHEAKSYLGEHPELEGLVPLLLDRGDRGGRELALHLAGLFRTPVMLAAVRDFALGQRGSDQLRIQAAQLAEQAGLLPASGAYRLWLGGTWRQTTIQKYEVHTDPVEHAHAPGVLDLMTQGTNALREGDAPRAERMLRQALAIDPDDSLVLNNLATTCAQLGRPDEAEALSIRLHERHPDYLFGRTALANLASQRGDLDRARELLEPLRSRQRLHVNEFATLCMAELNLHLAAGNLQEAGHWLDMWRRTNPDHPALGQYETRLGRRR